MNVCDCLKDAPVADALSLREVFVALQALPEVQPSADMKHSIMRKISALEGKRTSSGSFNGGTTPSWWLLGAAAAVLVLGFVAVEALRSIEMKAEPKQSSWLAQTQEADGTWTPSRFGGIDSYRPAVSALCALALAKESPESDAAKRAVEALRALLEKQGDGEETRAKAYNRAMAIYALAQLAPKGDAVAAETIRREVASLVSSQNSQGAWDYEGGVAGNTAITAWNIRALAAADSYGVKSAGVPMRKALRWIRNATLNQGAVAYRENGAEGTDCLCALTAHTLLTAGSKYGDAAALGRRLVERLKPSASGGADAYCDYAKIIAFDAAGAAGDASEARRRSAQGGSQDDAWERVGSRLYVDSLRKLAGIG